MYLHEITYKRLIKQMHISLSRLHVVLAYILYQNSIISVCKSQSYFRTDKVGL